MQCMKDSVFQQVESLFHTVWFILIKLLFNSPEQLLLPVSAGALLPRPCGPGVGLEGLA